MPHTPHNSRHILDDSFHCAGAVVAFAAHLKSTKIADWEECIQMVCRSMLQCDAVCCSVLQSTKSADLEECTESDKKI